jgi:DNA replication and repair protein RecF
MPIASIRTFKFRNLRDGETAFPARDVFLIGENGQGKTNYLEAIYFACLASSFRGGADVEVVTHEAEECSVIACLDGEPAENLRVTIQNREKIVYVDQKRALDRKALLEIVPPIAFCHDDLAFVSGPPDRRRWFFDQTICLFENVYLDELRRYKKLLKTRNSVLKSGDHSLMALIDPQLIQSGIRLMEYRDRITAVFSETFMDLYERIAGIDRVSVRYRPSWKASEEDSIVRQLQTQAERERLLGATLSGPHRDRFEFVRGGDEFAHTASTGQRRLLALLLRVAQAQVYNRLSGRQPILLLDDVLLELDPEKRNRFIAALPAYGQAFFTFLPDEAAVRNRNQDTLAFLVAEGELRSA